MTLTDEQQAAIRRAVHDPGAVVGKRYGPSWGRGNDGYAEEQESLWLWVVRAVTATVERELAKADDNAATWRDYSIEGFNSYDVMVVCRSDGGCEWSEETPEGRYFTLGEAVDAAQAHAAYHAQMDAEDG